MKNPRIIFRVDGGSRIGMGHIVRCIRLAEAINECIASQIVFATITPLEISRQLKDLTWKPSVKSFEGTNPGALFDFYDDFNPHAVITDLSLIDNLEDYIKAVEKVPLHVNLSENFFNYFNFGLVVFPSVFPVKPICRCETKADYFVGAKYILIDTRLKDLANPVFIKDKPLSILVALGGADPRGWTQRVMSIAKESGLNESTAILNVVIGPANLNGDAIKSESRDVPWINVIESQSSLYELINENHMALTSGGTTAYEAIAAGRPTWIIPEIEFEEKVAEILKTKNAILGNGIENLKSEFLGNLGYLHDNPQKLTDILNAGRRYIDGRGLERITGKITKSIKAMKSY